MTDSKHAAPLTEDLEKQQSDAIRSVYNSGDCARAVQMAVEFFNRHPESLKARYNFAVMHGDYADSPELSDIEKKRFKEIARKGFFDLFHDPKISEWDEQFQSAVRNEYFWFFEMHEEQYQLGIEGLNSGRSGRYSACVGASMMALKELREARVQSSEMWAERSFHYFQEFEKIDPTWYNINHFGAQALACLGRYDEAVECFRALYCKQGRPENKLEMEKFKNELSEIKRLREA